MHKIGTHSLIYIFLFIFHATGNWFMVSAGVYFLDVAHILHAMACHQMTPANAGQIAIAWKSIYIVYYSAYVGRFESIYSITNRRTVWKIFILVLLLTQKFIALVTRKVATIAASPHGKCTLHVNIELCVCDVRTSLNERVYYWICTVLYSEYMQSITIATDLCAGKVWCIVRLCVTELSTCTR